MADEANKTLDELVRERDPALAQAVDVAFSDVTVAEREAESLRAEVECMKARRDEAECRAFELRTKAGRLFVQQKRIAGEILGLQL